MKTAIHRLLLGLGLVLSPGCDNTEAAATKPAPAEKNVEPARAEPAKPAGPPLSGGKELLERLRSDFAEDHAAATDEYKGREISFDGKVSMLISDDSMRVNEVGSAGPRGGPSDLTCYGTVPDGLEVGSDVRIKGTLTGTVGNIVGANFQVKSCAIEVR